MTSRRIHRILSQLLPLVLLLTSFAGIAVADSPASNDVGLFSPSAAERTDGGPPAYSLLELSAERNLLAPGESLKLTLSGRADLGTEQAEAIDPAWADWSSSNPAAASAAGGTVTGLAAGSSVITAVYQGLSAAYKVTVAAVSPTPDAELISRLRGALDGLALGFAAGDAASAITQDLSLPAEAVGAPIVWTSSNPEILGTNGKVVRPGYLLGDAAVRLTAALDVAAQPPLVRSFDLVVLKQIESDADRVAFDKQQVQLYFAEPDNAASVTRSFGLLTQGERGSTITYRSGNPAIVADDGTVTPPSAVDSTVVFSAFISYNSALDRKDFVLTVKAANPGDVRVEELLPSRDRLDVQAGDGQIAIAVNARMTDGSFVDATDLGLWTSGDESVAAVSRKGIVRFAGEGETTVSFAYGGVTLTTAVSVRGGGGSGSEGGNGPDSSPLPSPSYSPEPGSSSNPTPKPSASSTPSASASAPATATPSPSPVTGASPSPAASVSPGVTPTPSGTATPSPSAPAVTPSPGAGGASPTPAVSPSPGQSAQPNPDPAPSPSAVPGGVPGPFPPGGSLPFPGGGVPVPQPAVSVSPSPLPEASATTGSPSASLIGSAANAEAVRLAVGQKADAAAPSFRDVPASLWSYKGIRTAARLGVVGGYGDGTFRPEAGVTRAEFARMLASALHVPAADSAVSGFRDTRGHWAAEPIAALADKGIVTGYADGSFRPDQRITRAEIVTVMARVAVPKGGGTAPAFTDIGRHWAKDAIAAFAASQIVTGKGGGRFEPDAPATRAEAAVLILRLLNAALELDLEV
ncbi:S-layer homology domain-containing protein [Gorillibacterium sp. sgz500922]|uniref:S-layer homology domain-containing protein n=1 Tax=Gorillibacterium sp. sgz500922 TaxID=3446694 RepID=UPI003F67D33D